MLRQDFKRNVKPIGSNPKRSKADEEEPLFFEDKVPEEEFEDIHVCDSSNVLESKNSSLTNEESLTQAPDSDHEGDEVIIFPNQLNSESENEEEKYLEKLVFGGEDNVLSKLNSLKEIPETETNPDLEPKRAAWVDNDDETIASNAVFRKTKLKDREKYSEQLREKFVATMGNPKWAQKQEKEDDDSDDEMLRTSRNFLGTSRPLLQGRIDLRKCQDLNVSETSNKEVKTVEFHPTSQVALVSDASGRVIIYQVDGKSNEKIQSIEFDHFKLSCAHFTMDGEQIVVGSREYSHFFYYDMMSGKIVRINWEKGLEHCTKKKIFLSPDGKFLLICGKYGHIHILSAKTKEWIGQLKMTDEVKSLAFSRNGKLMYSTGAGGKVFIWDLSTRQCIHCFVDQGSIEGTTLSISPNEQFLAVGSESGIVNIYENPSLISSPSPVPLKLFKNLTTDVSSVKFNHSSEILGMSSSFKDNSIKLAHFPSMTVFSNFPHLNADFKRVTAFDFSLNSGYFAFGTNKGRVPLYRLKKYENY